MSASFQLKKNAITVLLTEHFGDCDVEDIYSPSKTDCPRVAGV